MEVLDRITSEMLSNSFVVIDDFIDEKLRKELQVEQIHLLEMGRFHQAAVGNGVNKMIRPEIRMDEVLWLDPYRLTPVQQIYWDKIDQIRTRINRQCYLGLRSFECHFSRYPIDSFYKRHLDQFDQVIYRVVTVILYLNRSWAASDEGSLRLYLKGEDGIEVVKDILPIGGRLVVFFSGEVPHEVMRTNKERISMTGWLKDTD